jgi:protein-disulfide isomerase
VWQSPLVLVSVGAVASIGLLIVLLQRPRATSDTIELVPPPANVATTTLAAGEVLGRADAPLTLEIWADFQCPYCASLVKNYLPRLVSDFVLPGKIRIESHDVAILDRGASTASLDAAVGARCAGAQDRYWPFHDWLFYNQQGENRGGFSEARLGAIADAVALDRTRWDACVADPAQAAAIQQTNAAARAARIVSTPTLRFGGQVMTGLPRTYGDLSAALQAVLAPTGAGTTSSTVPSPATPAGAREPTTAP